METVSSKTSTPQILRKGLYPHFVFFVLYFILHQFNRSFGLLKAGVALQYALIYVAIGVILFVITRLLSKNNSTASLLTFTGVFIVIFFGNYHDAIKSWQIPEFFKRYGFQLTFIFSLFIVLSFFSVRRKWRFEKLNRFFMAMTTILFVWELVGLAFAYNAYQKKNFDLRLTGGQRVDSLPKAFQPNIYFIVFDSYTSSARLKKDFQFDNPIDSLLVRQGFFVATHSRSNYPSTALSIASTFNMNFLSTDFSRDNQFSKMLKEAYTVAHADLPAIFKRNGYEFVNCSIFDFVGQPAINGRLFSNLAERSLIEPTLIGRIWRDLAWQFVDVQKMGERATNKYKAQFIFQNVDSCISSIRANGKPRFVYCHVMLPHQPYLFTAEGKPRRFYRKFSEKELYLDQLMYTNTIIRSLVTNINAKEQGSAVIILEGDHGFREYGNHDEPLKEFDNLNAYYFPDRDYRSLYDSITPVNSFRVFMNKYFAQNLPLLRDSSIKVVEPATAQGLWPF